MTNFSLFSIPESTISVSSSTFMHRRTFVPLWNKRKYEICNTNHLFFTIDGHSFSLIRMAPLLIWAYPENLVKIGLLSEAVDTFCGRGREGRGREGTGQCESIGRSGLK